MQNFKKINIKDFSLKPFKWLDDDWMLITARKKDDFNNNEPLTHGSVNTMTASWGGLGIMWNLPVASIMVRPERFTKEFIDDSGEFSLTFFNHDKYKKALGYLGAISGRDEKNKIAKTNLTLLEHENIPYFLEAHTVINCKSIFNQVLTPEHFLDNRLNSFYKNNNYHHLYFGEIIDIFQK